MSECGKLVLYLRLLLSGGLVMCLTHSQQGLRPRMRVLTG